MKKFNAIYKRGNVEKAVVIEFHNIDLFVVIDEKGSKEVKRDTVRRWYTIGAEIVEKPIEEKKVKKAAKPKLYWYEYRLRGCSPGCQPNGFIEVNHDHGKFGAVAYDRKLSDQEIAAFELNEIKKSSKHSRSEVKKDGSVRQDKFKPKLNADQAYEILTAYHKGSKKAHLAREYQVSFRTVTCIVEGLMWKDVFAKFHAAS